MALPFLQRLQTSIGDYFKPEIGQNMPPDLTDFIPKVDVPSIGRTIRGILSSAQNKVGGLLPQPELLSPVPTPPSRVSVYGPGIIDTLLGRQGATPPPQPGPSMIPSPVPTQTPTPSPTATPFGLGSGMNPYTPPALSNLINQSAAKTKRISPSLLSELLFRESSFDPNKLGSLGEQGIAQFMPSTRADLVRRGILAPFDPYDPSQAIPAAALYLDYLIQQAQEDYLRGLAAYQGGLGGIESGLPRAREMLAAISGR